MIDARTLCPLALWVVGFVGARRLVRGARGPPVLAHLEAVGLAPAIGALLAPTSYFFAAAVTDRGVTRTSWTIAFAVVVAASAVLTHRRGAVAGAAPPATRTASPAVIVAACVLVLVLATLIAVELDLLPLWPHGQWDAQAIWNARARLLTRADGDWSERLHSFGLGHPDYPLLLPATVATCWMWSGTESVVYPQALAALFILGLALLVFTTAWRLGGPLAAALATPLVVWSPPVVLVGLAQYADVPLALFLLAAWGGLASLRMEGARGRASALATGAALGGLAWTKNEGILWAALLAGTWAAAEAARHRGQAVRRSLGSLLRGAAPALVALVLFKVSWSPTNDVMRDMGEGLLGNLASWERWRTTLGSVSRELALGTSLESWRDIFAGRPLSPEAANWAGVWLALGAAFVLGVRLRGLAGARDLAYGACSLGAIVVAIVLVYVVTPRDQAWHIKTSMTRLFLQAYPAIVVVVVSAVVRSREKPAASETPREPMAA